MPWNTGISFFICFTCLLMHPLGFHKRQRSDAGAVALVGAAGTTWVTCQKSERNTTAGTVIKCPKALWLSGTGRREEPGNLWQAFWHVSGIQQNGVLLIKVDCCSVLKLQCREAVELWSYSAHSLLRSVVVKQMCTYKPVKWTRLCFSLPLALAFIVLEDF